MNDADALVAGPTAVITKIAEQNMAAKPAAISCLREKRGMGYSLL